MTLSKREQILLSILLIFGIFAAGYYWVFQPMWNQHLDLQTKQLDLQTQYDEIMAEIDQIDDLNAQANELSTAIAQRTVKYFPSIIQEQLLLTMNKIANNNEIVTSDESYSLQVSFDHPDWQAGANEDQNQSDDRLDVIASRYQAIESGEEIAPTEEAAAPERSEEEQVLALAAVDSISSMSMNVRFPATYEQAMAWLSSVEGLDRSILCRSIDLAGSNENTGDGLPIDNPEQAPAEAPDNDARLLDCSFDLQFIAIPKLVAQDNDYENWPLQRAYGKMDPFTS